MDNLNEDTSIQLEIHGSKTQNGTGAGHPDVETINMQDWCQGGKEFLEEKKLGKEHNNSSHWKRKMQAQQRRRKRSQHVERLHTRVGWGSSAFEFSFIGHNLHIHVGVLIVACSLYSQSATRRSHKSVSVSLLFIFLRHAKFSCTKRSYFKSLYIKASTVFALLEKQLNWFIFHYLKM